MPTLKAFRQPLPTLLCGFSGSSSCLFIIILPKFINKNASSKPFRENIDFLKLI